MIYTEIVTMRRFSFTALILLLLIPVFFTGCATGGRYATFERSRDLNYMYLEYQVLPDHEYYTTGGYDKPEAILAVHKDYELDNSAGVWVHIPYVDYNQMRKWIDTIAPEQDYRYSNSYFAAYIVDPEGKRVGTWYAIQAFTTVKFLEGNRIQVQTPDVHLGIFRRGSYGLF